VIFCIGDRVSDDFGLPVARNQFVKSAKPRYPVKGICYEVFDPVADAPIAGTFVAGWAREASKGQVGLARKDSKLCSQAVMQYIEAEAIAANENALELLAQHLQALNKPLVSKVDWQRLESIEQQKAADLGVELFKFNTNAEMLAAMEV
jgi:hypothetical protein